MTGRLATKPEISMLGSGEIAWKRPAEGNAGAAQAAEAMSGREAALRRLVEGEENSAASVEALDRVVVGYGNNQDVVTNAINFNGTKRTTNSLLPVVVNEDGTFRITDWNGYPENGPMPKDDLDLINIDNYISARRQANITNQKIHKRDPLAKGKEIHEIHPVRFGGNPVDLSNKIYLNPEEHDLYTTWWNRLQKLLEDRGNDIIEKP